MEFEDVYIPHTTTGQTFLVLSFPSTSGLLRIKNLRICAHSPTPAGLKSTIYNVNSFCKYLRRYYLNLTFEL